MNGAGELQSRQRKSMGMKKAAWGILLLAGLSGCTSIGPSTTEHSPLARGWFSLHSRWQIWDKF
jgi:hypothetical protein